MHWNTLSLAARALSLSLFLIIPGGAFGAIVAIDFNDTDGPHWTGTVDTSTDSLTIDSWVENPGGINYWTPASLPLVWPAVDSAGDPFDVPDTFDGTIDNTFAFISTVELNAMSWNEGSSTEAGNPGWGGSGYFSSTIVSLSEDRFQPIPLSSSQSVISVGSVLAAPENPAPAVTIFDNGSPLAGEPGGYSDVQGNVNGQWLADDFTLSAAATVQQVVVYGSYFSGDTLPASDDFNVRFYNDSSGAPTGSPFASSEVSVTTRTDTGLISLNGLRVFRYELDLATPQAFAAGTPVWMSVFNDTPSITDDWLWSNTFSIGNNALSFDDGASWSLAGLSHMHFQLVSAAEPEFTEVSPGTGVGESTGGGSGTTGGVDVLFDDVTGSGTFTAAYDTPNAVDLSALLPPGAEPLINFGLSGDPAQVWNIDFDGTFTGDVSLTLSYDDTILSVLEADLVLWHFDDGAWVQETNGFILDTIANTITIDVDSFSPFMLGVAAVPEPSTYGMAAMGLLGVGLYGWRRKRA